MPLDHAELAAPLRCRSQQAEYHSATPVAVRLAAFGASSTGAGTARGVPGEVRHCSTHTHTQWQEVLRPGIPDPARGSHCHNRHNRGSRNKFMIAFVSFQWQ